MITIAELFPLYKTATKWQSTFRQVSSGENIRLEKEYTIHNLPQLECDYTQDIYTIDEELHRRDGPAETVYRNGKIYWEYWVFHGLQDRKDGPSSISYHENGNIRCEDWCINGNPGRLDNEKPTSIHYYEENGAVCRHEWWTDGVLHRTTGPAVVAFATDGRITIKEWWTHEELHREDGPARIQYWFNGKIFSEEWWLHCKQHRDNGPALTEFGRNGKISYQEWWINGKKQ